MVVPITLAMILRPLEVASGASAPQVTPLEASQQIKYGDMGNMWHNFFSGYALQPSIPL